MHKHALMVVSILVLAACSGKVTQTDSNSDSSTSVTGTGGNPATSTTTSGSSSTIQGGAGGSSACDPTLNIEIVTNNNEIVPEGWNDLPTITVKFIAGCKIEVSYMEIQLISPDAPPDDFTPFCAAPCAVPEDWNFRDFRIYRNDYIVMGPAELEQKTLNVPAVAAFSDPFEIAAGDSVTVTLRMNVSGPLPSPAAHGKRFQALLRAVGTTPSQAVVETSSSADPNAFITVQ